MSYRRRVCLAMVTGLLLAGPLGRAGAQAPPIPQPAFPVLEPPGIMGVMQGMSSQALLRTLIPGRSAGSGLVGGQAGGGGG